MILSIKIPSDMQLSLSCSYWLSLAYKTTENYTQKSKLSNQKQCILLKDEHQWLLRQGSFYSKYKYHHAFCWVGDQRVLNNILRFLSFRHQHWNQDISLISRLYQICVHSHFAKLCAHILLRLQWHIEGVCSNAFRSGVWFNSGELSVIKRI